jgi:iron(III) transport system permease protein
LLPFFGRVSMEMLSRISFDNYAEVFANKTFRTALTNSVILAILTPTVVMGLTAVIAWIVYRSRIRGASALDFLAFLPIAVPGLVFGIALITFYVSFPLPIYGTLILLLIAFTTKFLPYGMRTAGGSIAQIHQELEEAGAASGASWWQTFRRITLPLLRPGLAAGWVYICIVSFRELSTSILLTSPDTPVLPVLLFQWYSTDARQTQVAAIGVIMILVLVSVVVVFRKLVGRIGLQL